MNKLLCTVLVCTMLLISFPFTAFSLSNDTRTYSINIHTKDEADASTNGDIYLKLYGDKGETAFWKVTDDITDNAAQPGRLQTDDSLACVIRERDVGRLTKIKIAYYQSDEDDNTWGIDWLELDGARYPVKKMLSAEAGYPCVLNVELDHPEDGQPTLDRYLVMEGKQYDKLPDISYDKSYSIQIKTGNNPTAETNEIVRLQLVGSNGESDWLTINGNNGNGNNIFNRGTESTFFLSGQRDIGETKEIRIKMGTTTISTDSGWQLESICVEDKELCVVNQWLQSADYLSIFLDTPPDLMLIKTDPKTSASILSAPILAVIIGGSMVILTTAVVAAFIVKKRKRTMEG